MECNRQDVQLIKKPVTPTDRKSDPEAIFMLRAFSLGVRFSDLFDLERGEVWDMMTEYCNDREKYDFLATQDDMDNFMK